MFRCGKSVTCTSSEFDGLGLKNLFEVANIKLLDSKEITREFMRKSLTIVTKSSTLDVAAVLDPPLIRSN